MSEISIEIKEEEEKDVNILDEKVLKDKGVEENNNKDNKIEIINSESNNNLIVIDPGHANKANNEKEPISPGSEIMKIKDGGGATGNFTGVPEYKVTMSVSLKLKNLLQSNGYRVIMTKTSHYDNLGNIERAKVGNNVGAALVIRIHADSADIEEAYGASVLIPGLNEYTASIYDESARCGGIIIDTLTSQVGMYNRGSVTRQDITGFNWSKVPVVLIEMGFLSNENEDKLLNTDEYQNKIAEAIADGIKKAVPIDKEKENQISESIYY